MVGHGGSRAGSYLADPTSPIPSHCASIVTTSTLRVKIIRVVFASVHYGRWHRTASTSNPSNGHNIKTSKVFMSIGLSNGNCTRCSVEKIQCKFTAWHDSEAEFLYCCPDCPDHLNSIDWATLASVKKCSFNLELCFTCHLVNSHSQLLTMACIVRARIVKLIHKPSESEGISVESDCIQYNNCT